VREPEAKHNDAIEEGPMTAEADEFAHGDWAFVVLNAHEIQICIKQHDIIGGYKEVAVVSPLEMESIALASRKAVRRARAHAEKARRT
jgi:hypothetical protein